MNFNGSHDASFGMMRESDAGKSRRRAAIAGCLALVLWMAPGLTWAVDNQGTANASARRLIDHQRLEALKEQIANLRERVKTQKQNQNGNSTAATLDALQAKVAAMESSISTFVNVDSTFLSNL